MSKVEVINAEETDFVRCITHLSAQTVIYSWSVNNFSLCREFFKKKLFSPTFIAGNASFSLLLRTSADREGESDDAIYINLCKLKRDGTCPYVKYEISLLDAEGTPVSAEDEMLFSDEHQTARLLAFTAKGKMDSLLLEDKLTIQCKMKILSENALKSGETPFSAKIYKSKIFLCESDRPPLIMLFCLLILCLLTYIQINERNKFMADKCAVYYNDMHKVIVDSTFKLISIAEALNLSGDINSEFISAYIQRFNLTVTVPFMHSINGT